MTRNSRRATVTAIFLSCSALGVSALQTAQAPPASSAAASHSTLPGNPWPPARKAGPASPALTPEEEAQTFSVPPGYHVELVASEPLIDSPIAIDFDADGRLWVLQTPAFLPDMSGRDSRAPINKVVVLEDTDDDGRMDKSTVFADGLVMPRALKVLDGGRVLVGEPPNLWLLTDTDGDLKADTKSLIVDTYGNANGGIEHNANSLFWAMDNVMYSSEHTFNLTLRDGTFRPIPTLSRGQWQISQDDAGRIYRNVNDAPLFVDYTPASYFLRNPNAPRTRGLYESLIDQIDATVYPVRNTRGVNRGYRDEYFRADGSSIVIQGAGTPTVYRGDRYPQAARGTVFISDSPTNLVHQMTVADDARGQLTAKNTYPRGEFFASSDERCRPVNLYSAPDGNMYIVDMYRGVVQAGGIWSEYLTDYIKQHDLQLPVARGRIWRVVYGTGPTRRGPRPALSSASPARLVETLAHPNGWWRDTAQQLLVQRNAVAMAPQLTQLATTAPDWRTKLHALWTLDGLDRVEPATVQKALADPSPDVRAAAIRISERWLGQPNHPIATAVLARVSDRHWNVRRQLAASIGALPAQARVEPAVTILMKDGADPIIVDAAVSSLKDVDADVLDRMMQAKAPAPPGEAITMLSAAVAKAGNAAAVQRIVDVIGDATRPAELRASLLRGLDAALPVATAGRGGRAGGRGLPGLSAPGVRAAVTPGRGVSLAAEPVALTALSDGSSDIALLARSVAAKLNWTGKPAPPPPPAVAPLTADEQKRFEAGRDIFRNLCAGCHNDDGLGKDKLGASLVGSKYVQAAPVFSIRILTAGKEGPIGLMPPLFPALNDDQIAAALTYIRREWGHTASPVTAIEVREARQSSPHKGVWTEAELAEMLTATGRGGRAGGGANN